MAAFAIYLAHIRNDPGFVYETLPARICDACDVALTVTIVPVSSGNHFRLFMRSLPRGVVYFASLGMRTEFRKFALELEALDLVALSWRLKRWRCV